MPAVLALARNTLIDALHRKLLYVIVFFAIIGLFAVSSLTYLAPGPGEEIKMFKDVGLATMTVFGVVLVLFTGMTLIPTEVEKRTVHTILAKPVRRWQFVLGKYLGALAVIGLSMLIMVIVMMAIAGYKEKGLSPALLAAAFLTFWSMAVLDALVLMVSTVSSTIMTVICGILFWGIGSGMEAIKDIVRPEHYAEVNRVAYFILLAVSKIFPNFNDFDIRQPVAVADPIAAVMVYKPFLYGLIFIVIGLALAMLMFNEREV